MVHSSVFGMLEIVEKDFSFVRLSHLGPELLHFMFFKMASAAILNIKKVPITFQRFIGAYFLFKWFLKSNPSRKKGSK